MNYIVKRAVLQNEKDRIKKFLNSNSLQYDDIDYSWYIEDINDNIIATVSVSSYIIKCFLIKEEYRGEQLTNLLISNVYSFLNNCNYFQIYTKRENKKLFESLGFKEVASTNYVTLLESKTQLISEYLKKLKKDYNITSKNNAAIIMNANPFTNGHLHLIKEALKENNKVLVFVLEEEKSKYSFYDRIRLVREATKTITNVIILPSTKYIISSSTFPTYFLKDDVNKVDVEGELDATIFKNYFMPIFDIKRRYVGEEIDPVTARYNIVLKNVLKDNLKVIKRLTTDSKIISASVVRSLAENLTDNCEEIKELVPETTFKFLKENK